ncbi:MAG: ATP-dependent DNA ligase [Dehalococcoidia bacterium]|nr:ATP-dependent DNA ligase [Dehalococcoidia bacterium]
MPDGGGGWLYEPKWDGFRTLVYFDGDEVYLQSRDLKPMGRYFPELVSGLRETLPTPVILDGEVVVMGAAGLDFGLLQMRIHPAESRIRKLSAEIPATFVAFDLLAEGDEDLRTHPFEERHRRLLAATKGAAAPFVLTPSTKDRDLAQDWFTRFEGAGFDGVIAKRLSDRYQPGVRAMLKIKHLRTADCVVAGFRWQTKYEDEAVGSLLLGLYDDAGVLHHVGHTSSFTMAKKRELTALLAPYRTEDDADGFGGGRTPGAPSRWSSGKDVAWNRLRPELVCEVSFDHLQGDRFRHGTTFRRWRPDKPAEHCTYSQLDVAAPAELRELLDDVRDRG